MAKEATAEKRISDIQRKTRRRISAEEKVRIVIEAIACLRHHGILHLSYLHDHFPPA